LLTLLVAALVAGCSAAPAPAPVPPTKTPKPTFTPTAVPTEIPFATAQPIQATAEAAATAANQPTQAPAATTEPTAAPTEAPKETKLTATQNVNVRSGPGTAYPAVGRLAAGDSFVVTGRSDAGDWVKFDFNGKDGWATAALVEVAGDLNAVAIAEAPALPTPRPQPTARPRPPAQPTNPPAPTSPPAPPAPQYQYTYAQGSANCQPNAGTTYFNGLVKYKSGAMHNGVCVHIAFYGPRQTKCSGCGGVGDGNWGFSPFGGPAPAGTTVEIYVTSCDGVVNGDKSQFDGPPAPISDKWVHTVSASEQCTGITFVGD
jgi:hypothetical protein